MYGQTSSAGPRPTSTPAQNRARVLERVLGDTSVDEHGVEQHGLAWWYPQVKQWPTVRSVGRGGSSGGASLPLNVEALDFIGGKYFIGESHDDVDDPDNYRDGFELTVRELEKSVRRALGQLPPTPLPRAADPLQPEPAVVAAIEHLLSMAPVLADNFLLTTLVCDEAIRLIVRARGMMHGSRFTAGRSQCPHCYEIESVVADEDRAVCVNPFCRDALGGRHCWRMLPVDANDRPMPGAEWTEVNEPDLRGRGQVTDEQLSRWADVG